MMDELDEEEKDLEEEDIADDEMFIRNLNSTLHVDKDFDMKEFNYEWLDIMEDCIPYIDNILRNPKRFIINEEEIVKVELARRVTVESVIHLSQHTNLIQKIEDNGDVKPSKILNINKEESMDTYENRFIYTLVNHLRFFFENRIEVSGGNSYCHDKNLLNYTANSKVHGDELKISVEVSDITKTIAEHSGERRGLTYAERIQKIKRQIDGFFGTEMIQTLSKLHVPYVHSPIKKTNVILKNPNFRKAEELWNFIQAFESKDKRKKEKKEFFDKGILKNEYDQAFLMVYLANKNFIDNTSGGTETAVIQQMIQRLIDNLMETDSSLSEDKLEDIFHKQISLVREKNNYKKKRIQGILENRLEREFDSIQQMLQSLQEGSR